MHFGLIFNGPQKGSSKFLKFLFYFPKITAQDFRTDFNHFMLFNNILSFISIRKHKPRGQLKG